CAPPTAHLLPASTQTVRVKKGDSILGIVPRSNRFSGPTPRPSCRLTALIAPLIGTATQSSPSPNASPSAPRYLLTPARLPALPSLSHANVASGPTGPPRAS